MKILIRPAGYDFIIKYRFLMVSGKDRQCFVSCSNDVPKDSSFYTKSAKNGKIDDYKIDLIINKVLEVCIDFSSKTCLVPVVACMGLTSTPDCDDLQNSFAKYVITRIIATSRAEVLVVEPNLHSHKSFRLTSLSEAYDSATIVVWLVKHKQFLSIKRSIGKTELDFCGINESGYYGFPV